METTHGLYITGRRVTHGFIVLSNDSEHVVPDDPHDWLLELGWASLTTESGILYNELSFVIDNDHQFACQLAKRLRKHLCSKHTIENCGKGYRLADNLCPPTISRAVLECPYIHPGVIRRIEELFVDCNSRDIAKPFATATS